MEPFDWDRILLGEDKSWGYLPEVVFRTVVMYVIMLLFFKVSGKKEIRQLSIFELILIIGLGSAAGDPMFYDDVPLLHALTVFIIVLLLYQLLSLLSRKSHKLNKWLEGVPVCVVCDNRIRTGALAGEGFSVEELFAELRQKGVMHLGQVDRVYLEASGECSIFFREDEQVVHGLCIFPESLAAGKNTLTPGVYSCVQCGYTVEHTMATTAEACPQCHGEKWSQASCAKRIS